MPDDAPQTPTEITPKNVPEPLKQPDEEYPSQQPSSTQTTDTSAEVPVFAPMDSTVARVSTFEAEPPTQAPTSPVEPEAPSPFLSPLPVQPKKSRKGLIAGVVASVLLVLGMGSGALAYTFVYQAPEKVLADAATNLIQARAVVYDGTALYESTEGDMRLKVVFDGNADRANNREKLDITLTVEKKVYNLKASFVQTEDPALYFKIENLLKTVNAYQETEKSELPSGAVKLLEAIDNRWVKISLTDIKEWSKEFADTQKCTSDILRNVKTDDAKFKEIADVYAKNPFVVAKDDPISRDGNIEFGLDTDEARLKSFVSGLNTTELMKQLQKCDDSYKLDPNDYKKEKATDGEESNVRVSIGQWDHQLRNIKSTFKNETSKGSLYLEPRFVDKTDVKPPSDAMTYKELQKLIEDAQEEITEQYIEGDGATPVEA